MLKIRLRRMGTRNRPFYRVVVSDSRKVPTGAAVEEIGYYDPRPNPSVISIDRERIEFWRGRGAQLSDTVQSLLRKPNNPLAAPASREGAAEAAVEG